MTPTFEANFDGLVGPTHNYSGLSHGNIASTAHRAMTSNPLEAVLQGLKKMKWLSDLGFVQGVLPPQERPEIDALRQLGFEGSEKSILEKVGKVAPELLHAVCSSSSMWTANAATVSPSPDTEDQKTHFTPANLVSKYHRFIESTTTSRILKAIFHDPHYFTHHSPLPGVPLFGDEGAANHTRLCQTYDQKGIEFFVYGRRAFDPNGLSPKRFVARQTFEASEAIVRLHRLKAEQVVFAQQNPEAIDAGVFHNDVAGVGNQNVYFYHEHSFLNSQKVFEELKNKFQTVCGQSLQLISVPESQVTLSDAVGTYLFNSQLVSLPTGGMVFILPKECEDNLSVKRYMDELLQARPDLISGAYYFDLKQSMCNGGGPACLRLRVVLSQKERESIQPQVFMNDRLYSQLVAWAKKNYRDKLSLDDLRDYRLLDECRTALDQLTSILKIGSIYPFQKASD